MLELRQLDLSRTDLAEDNAEDQHSSSNQKGPVVSSASLMSYNFYCRLIIKASGHFRNLFCLEGFLSD